MDYPHTMLVAAHRHCIHHREELERSGICGCFHCCQTFAAATVEEWVDEDGTAICPHCSVDSVIGSASGYPSGDKNFLRAMHALWFDGNTPPASSKER
jgi:hypothetical protein